MGSWTFFKSTDPKRMAAAWLYAQFVTAKTVSLKKSITGLTLIRDSDIHSEFFTKNAANYGGLIEFYRSPARVAWTPTGNNVPDYPKLAQLWWKNVATAVTGEKTPQAAMDNLANEMDQVMARLERAGMAQCAPCSTPRAIPTSGCRTSRRRGRSWPTKSPRARRSLMTRCCRPGRRARYAEHVAGRQDAAARRRFCAHFAHRVLAKT